jgi:chromosome segregation ATPase
MFNKDESKQRHLSFIQEMEGHFEKIFAAKNDEVNKALEERIKTLREEAEAKAAQYKEEIAQARQELEQYSTAAGELEERGEEINVKIKELLDQADRNKQEIMRLTDAAAKDLAGAQELDAQRAQIQKEADARARALKTLIVEKNQIEAKIPEFDLFKDQSRFDIVRESNRLNAIRSLLIAVEAPPAQAAEEKAKTPPPTNPIPAAEPTLAEILKKLDSAKPANGLADLLRPPSA